MTICSWSLFRVTWDSGAWWALDLDNVIALNGKKRGVLSCFVEVTILGIGIRRWYTKQVIFDEQGLKDSIKERQ